MLTYSFLSSSKSWESIVVQSELLLSAASVGTTATSEATASASATTWSLFENELVLLSLEGEEVGELSLSNSDVVDFLILKNGIDLLDLFLLGSSCLEASSLLFLVTSGLFLKGGSLLLSHVLSKGE